MKTDKHTKPNIVIILADDMGYSDVSCFGSEIPTPNIDRLGCEGVRFTQMYNCARCCPSRASLLTGLYPHQAGIGHMVTDLGDPAYQGYLNQDCVTIAEALKTAGYKTLMSGKWHVGGSFDLRAPQGWALPRERHPTPTDRGFDEFFGTLDGCGSYFNPHTLMRNDQFIPAPLDQRFYYTDAISNEAVQMIDQNSGKDPFFLYVAYTAPHWPLHALPEDIAMFEGSYRAGWDRTRLDRYDRMKELGLLPDRWNISPRDPDAPPWDSVQVQEWEDMKMAVYAAQIRRMDKGIGNILDALDNNGCAEHTLVMFMSDNGGCAELLEENGFVEDLIWPNTDGTRVRAGNIPSIMPGSEQTYMSYDLPWANASNTPYRLFKHWVHEGGISTPFVARCPSIRGDSGDICHSPCHFVDIMATCLDIAGVAYPQYRNERPTKPLQGESFLQALRGKQWERFQPIVWEHEGNQALRTRTWKLVRKYNQPWELYNFEEDRTELLDRSAKEPARLKTMEKQYLEWAARTEVREWDSVKAVAREIYPGIV